MSEAPLVLLGVIVAVLIELLGPMVALGIRRALDKLTIARVEKRAAIARAKGDADGQ